MEAESVTIVLPLPSPYLHPNKQPITRKGHIVKAKATKARRKLARQVADAEQVESGPWQAAEVQPVFFHKVNRRRDADNAIAWLKATMDGIADAGIVENDSRFTWASPEFKIDKQHPRVEITLVRA